MKRIKILLIISVILLLFFVQDSYAKYLTSTSEEANITIARWKILVNDEDIRNESTANAIITPVFPGTEHIASNIIAPSSEGYFDLIIDAREADVSFKYQISIEVDENSSVKDLIATKYQINDGEEILFEGGNQTIENTVLYRDNTNLINIRIYIMWNDDENATMNNQADTEATVNSDKALINVKMNFIQVVSTEN